MDQSTVYTILLVTSLTLGIAKGKVSIGKFAAFLNVRELMSITNDSSEKTPYVYPPIIMILVLSY